jgi:predicted RNase H-like nuclease
LIGVDAPLVIRNQEGMREADKLMHRHFGRFHAGAYPANLGLPHARRPLELSRMLEELGFQHGAAMQARASGRWQIEIHPHAAIVQLFDLPRIIRYKRGSVAERRAELTRYRELLCSQLPQLMPACDVNGHLPEIAGKGRALKDCEDRIDAVISAYIAAHWWYWGSERNTVFGDADDGYIIVPHRVQAG